MRLAALVVLSLAVAAPAGALELRSQPIPLDPGDPGRTEFGALRYCGGLVLTSPDGEFGGWSAMHLAEDGVTFTAISDSGGWMTGELIFRPDGRLTHAGTAEIGRLLDESGRPLPRKTPESDAEAIAVTGDGRALVAFERHHRILSYPMTGAAPDGTPRPYGAPAEIREAPNNGGLEAITTLADGRLLLIAEEMAAGPDSVAAWVGSEAQGWQALSYAVDDRRWPTGAATLPGGDVVVVERRFDPLSGLWVRLVRHRAADIVPGALLRGEVLASLAPPLAVDNFEAVAVRQAAGRTQLLILSDDNFNPLQRTLLLCFEME